MANLAPSARSCIFRISLRASPPITLPHRTPECSRGDVPRVVVVHSWSATQVHQQAQGRAHA